ncbi:hypothetical protein BB561_000738 [Smittium simulii]|uniref:histone acetyltransferase n=1 Tax=Smittium simulii TaxID=133385 RepID=A0A2T9YXV5_9FUNG|nr:hypothetical protein BB561_000738 [Smittium simulii]
MTKGCLQESVLSILETFPENQRFKLLTSITTPSIVENLTLDPSQSNGQYLLETTQQRTCMLLATIATPQKTDLIPKTLKLQPPQNTLSLSDNNFCFVSGIQTREYIVYKSNNSDDILHQNKNAKLPNIDNNTHNSTSNNKNPNVQKKIEQIIIYIEKIDSVGLDSKLISENKPIVGYARALVVGYLDYIYNHKYNNLDTEIFIYTYSKSQPEYLFAESKANPTKKILENQLLNNWWQHTLELSMKYALNHLYASDKINSNNHLVLFSDNCKASVFIPNVESCMIKWAINNIKTPVEPKTSEKFDKIKKFWKFEIPFASNKIASETLPCFPDDPISRLLGKEENKTATVNEIFELLAFTEECGIGRQTAFFYIFAKTCKNNNCNNGDNSPNSCSVKGIDGWCATDGFISDEEMEKLNMILFDYKANFSNLEMSLKSTSSLLGQLEPYSLHSEALGKYNSGNVFEKLKILKSKLYLPPKNEVNMVSSKKRDSTQSVTNLNTVNLLAGSLIKRKKKN